MQTQRLKGWRCFPPKDDLTVLTRALMPCLQKHRTHCEICGSCVYAMGDEKKGKHWFKKCERVEFRIVHINARQAFTVLGTSKIRFR